MIAARWIALWLRVFGQIRTDPPSQERLKVAAELLRLRPGL